MEDLLSRLDEDLRVAPAPSPDRPPLGEDGEEKPRENGETRTEGGDGAGALEEEPLGSHDWSYCEDCGVATVASVVNFQTEDVCPLCGRLYERPSEEEQAQLGGPSRPLSVRAAPRLRIVGPEAGRHQRLLDRSAHVDTQEACASELYKELLEYNHQYRQRTGKAYCEEDLNWVAETYVYTVRPEGGVIRSKNKQAILATLLYHRCIEKGRSRNEASEMLQLNNTGLARGENRLREMNACTQILNTCQDGKWISATFTKLGLVYSPHTPCHEKLASGFPLAPGGAGRLGGEEPARPPKKNKKVRDRGEVPIASDDAPVLAWLRETAAALLRRGKELHVGIEFVPRTRATGAVYVALRRAELAGKIPAHWGFGDNDRGSAEWVAQRCNIRRQTVEGYLRRLHEYHSYFAPLYEEHGLFSGAQDRL